MSTRTITGFPRRVWGNPRLCPDLSILFPTFSEEAFGVGSSEISCPRSTTDRPRHFQTSNWTNRSHFSINRNRPRHLWQNFKKSNILTFFSNRSSDFDPPRLNWQHQPTLKWTKIARYYMETLLWGKRWHNKSWKMAEHNSGSLIVPIIISGQGNMVCWLVGGKCVVPDHPRWTLDSPRHFQTSKGTNTNNFPVNQNHPRRPQTPLTELQKIQDFDFFLKSVKWLWPPEAQLATSSVDRID